MAGVSKPAETPKKPVFWKIVPDSKADKPDPELGDHKPTRSKNGLFLKISPKVPAKTPDPGFWKIAPDATKDKRQAPQDGGRNPIRDAGGIFLKISPKVQSVR